jgi:hypothetical protein
VRRAEVVENLAKRPSLSHEDWHRRYGEANGISLEFVRWFRDTCSRSFEYDLSAALLEDDLVKDLGMFEATWGDVDWDILEEFEKQFGKKFVADKQKPIKTFGEFLQALWSQSR